MAASASSESTSTDSERTPAFDRVIDWVLGTLLTVVGVLVALGGIASYYGLTRRDIADAIHSNEFQSDVLTEAEAIDVLVALSHWAGIGLTVVGGLVVVLGVAVVVAHNRARRDGRKTPRWIIGIVGASVSSVLGVVPLSPICGGMVAGYLDQSPDASGVEIGTLAGVFQSVPLIVIIVFASVGVILSAPGELAVAVVFSIVLVVLLSLVYFAGLSAFGGYVGSWVRTR